MSSQILEIKSNQQTALVVLVLFFVNESATVRGYGVDFGCKAKKVKQIYDVFTQGSTQFFVISVSHCC